MSDRSTGHGPRAAGNKTPPGGVEPACSPTVARGPMTVARLGRKGQAMTEMVLLFPIFLFFLFGFVKVFSLLVLVQKMEIAAIYAATRWQFESHQNVDYAADDEGQLLQDINRKTRDYLGFNNVRLYRFLDLHQGNVTVNRLAVWSIVTLKVTTKPWKLPFMKNTRGLNLEVTKYVPSRDRPIGYVLPGG